MAGIALQARLIGADREAKRFSLAALHVQSDVEDAVKDIGERADTAFTAHALKRSGRMARGIVSHAAGAHAIVTVTARDPETGFDYVRVTRFGHNTPRIWPRRGKTFGAANVLSTHRSRRGGRRGALRLPGGGFFSSVPAFHPSSDWAEQALPQVEVQVGLAARALARKLEEEL